MRVVQSTKAKSFPLNPDIAGALDGISEDPLREIVETIAIPRHFTAERDANSRVADWIEEQLRSFGYRVERQGEYRNLMTLPACPDRAVVLVGAHYDSVPRTPGADDNASAVAAMLGCAKAVAEYKDDLPVCFVAFNCEEDGLLGSRDFVENLVASGKLAVREAHVLEMVGYCDKRPGSQSLPPGLPIKLASDRGDFLGILGNKRSTALVDRLMSCAKTYVSDFPVLGLKIYFGLERFFPHLERSDHASFWNQGTPALMWTDTSEFRNPHYHQRSDTPETLDYEFLGNVTRLLTAQVLTSAQSELERS